MTTVLITGARAPVAVHLARLFHAAGHRAVLADTQSSPIGRHARLAAAYLRLPPPRRDLGTFAAALAKAAAAQGVDLIIPTCEEVFYLAAARDLAGLAVPVLAPPLPLLTRAHHKGTFAQLATGHGADPPATVTVESATSLHELGSLGGKVLKPAWSRFASRVLVRPSTAEVAHLGPTPADPWVVQDYLPGEELCAYGLARHGELLAFAAYRPLYRAGLGAGIAFEPVAEPVAHHFAAGFARSTGWSGQLSFDFRRDAAGALHVIECNPRATSGLHFFGLADGLAEAMLTGRPAAPSQLRTMTLPLAMLAYGLPTALRSGEAGRWWRDFRRFGDILACPGDSRLGLAQVLALGEIAVLAARTGQTLQQAATADIEWNGEPFA